MPKAKTTKPILKLVPPSPWLQKTVHDIPYWVHVPSRRSGIHIRGLARLCGVTHRVIQNAIQKTKKADGEVAQNYKTELNNLLKDKVIFLEEVAQNSPGQQGGPVKVICADVCGILIRYYAEKEHKAAMKSAIAFMQLGIEQYIFTQVGFIPKPESIVINDIDFLIAKETIQVNKSRLEEARFFTNPITGECGIDVQSLGFLCGGVALRHIEAFLDAHNEPFLKPEQPERIVKAAVCAATLHHFGEVHTPRKTLAQYWSKALDPIVPTLHQKTNYQAKPTTDRETQLEMRLQELEREVIRYDKHMKLEAGQFQLYAVATHYPEALAKEIGTAWQPTDRSGVYRLLALGLTITVIVTSQIPSAPHNMPWNLLSHDPELIRYALNQAPLAEDLRRHFESELAYPV